LDADSETWGHDGGPTLGIVLGCGDVDGDGLQEALTGLGATDLLIALEWPLPASSADAQSLIPQGSEAVYEARVDVQDFDGSGSPDVVLDISYANPGVVSGIIQPATANLAPEDAPIQFHFSTTANWRPTLATAGDVNGDGHKDIVGGDVTSGDGRGVAWILLGPISAGTYTIDDADGTFSGSEPDADCDAGPNCVNYGSWVGKNVNSIGDVNLDGYDDIAIAAPHHSPDPTLHGPGVVYLFFGGE